MHHGWSQTHAGLILCDFIMVGWQYLTENAVSTISCSLRRTCLAGYNMYESPVGMIVCPENGNDCPLSPWTDSDMPIPGHLWHTDFSLTLAICQ